MPKGTAVGKRLLQLAGEYAVAAQMALHGWHASLTVGNFPEIDIVAYKPETGKRVTVQVKTARKRDWPVGYFERNPTDYRVWGIMEEADVYILVHLPEKDMMKVEFFVIEPKQLKELCERAVASLPPPRETSGKPRVLPMWERWKKVCPDVWDEFFACKDRWDLLDEVAK